MKPGAWLALAALLTAPAVQAGTVPAPLLRTVHFTSPSAGWAVADTPDGIAMLRTADGGRHWRDVTPRGFLSGSKDSLQQLTAEAYSGARTAWIGYTDGQSARFARTTDAGAHWRTSRLRLPEDYDDSSLMFCFLDARRGALLMLGSPGMGQMAKATYWTEDGGRTWRLRSSSVGLVEKTTPGALPFGGFYPSGIALRDARHGWITGTFHADYTPLFRADDGVRRWRSVPLSMPRGFAEAVGNTYPPAFFGPGKRDGVLPADLSTESAASTGSVFYVTHNGGASWQCLQRRALKGVDAASAFFLNRDLGWMPSADGKTLLKTRNGGRTWTPCAAGVKDGRYQLDFIDPRHGWRLLTVASTEDRARDRWTLQATADGGSTWRTVSASR